MASRSQMRLAQLTGSLDSTKGAVSAEGLIQDQSLQGVMDHLASAIKRITGGGAYHSQAAGLFSQDLDINGKIDVQSDISGSAHLMVAQNSDLKGTLAVAGQADFANHAVVASGYVYKGDLQYSASAGTGISMVDFYNNQNVDIAVDTTWLRGTGISVDDTTSIDLTMDSAGEITAALLLSGSSSNDALEITADGLDLKSIIARNRTFSDDVTVSGKLTVGADLEVNGTLTYIDTTNLQVTDKKVVIADSAASDVARNGAGIYIGSDANANYAIFWDEAAGQTRWKANDQFHAPILQSDVASALYLRSDADGDIQAGNAADLVNGIKAQFTGSNIAVSDNGSGLITHSISAGTGVSVDNAVIAIGQPVATSDTVTFAGITDSSLAADKIVASVSGELVNIDLDDWIAGTANQVIVTDDTDGSVTLSLPQNIHTAATPEFAALNIGSNGDISLQSGDLAIGTASGSGANLYLYSDAGMGFDDGNKPDASGQSWDGADLELSAAASSWDAYAAAFGTVSLLDAIVAAGQGDQYADKYTFHVSAQVNKVTSTDFGAPAGGGAMRLSDLLTDFDDATRSKRIDVYVNGQLMREGAGNDYQFDDVAAPVEIDFSFNLEADDIVQMIVR